MKIQELVQTKKKRKRDKIKITYSKSENRSMILCSEELLNHPKRISKKERKE